jgi:hypothetical protein
MSVLLMIFLTLIILFASWDMRSRERMIQFPFLATIVFGCWMAPQFIGLHYKPGPFVNANGYESALVMAILCLAAGWIGYHLNQSPTTIFKWKLDRSRLLFCSSILSILGAYFFYQVTLLAPDVILEMGGRWSGQITIFNFLSKMTTVGLAIAMLLLVRRVTPVTLMIVALDLSLYMHRVIIQGRRGALIELGVMAVFSMWFYKKWLPSRWVMVTAIMTGTLFVFSIADYRSLMLERSTFSWSGAGVEEILDIDFLGNMRKLLNDSEYKHEVTNAVVNIEAAKRMGHMDYGLSLWNEFVHTYIPGQLLGAGFKAGLKVDLADPVKVAFSRYNGSVGSTVTGLTDSFLSFGYFGCIKFFVIGYIMSKLYLAAKAGSVSSQLVLILVTPAALHAITHSTHWFFLAFVQVAVFAIPAMFFALHHDPLQNSLRNRRNNRAM